MMNRNAVFNKTFAAIAVVSAAVVGIVGSQRTAQLFAGDANDPPLQDIRCKKTTTPGKCGTDLNLAPMSCGGQTCYQTVITYGQITNCETSQDGGLLRCCKGSCNKITYTQKCEASQCVVDGEPSVVEEIPRSYSCGPECPPQQ